MRFDLRRPCPHCPFRTDGDGYLRVERAQGIALALARGGTFPCHRTTATIEDEDGCDTVATADSQFCAGALIMLEREGVANQAMRVAEGLGLYDPAKLDMGAPVGRVSDFIERHRDANDEPGEPCSVADAGCLAPAGYLEGGIAVPVDPEEEVGQCEECCEPVCENCGEQVAGRFVCPACAEYDREHANSVAIGNFERPEEATT